MKNERTTDRSIDKTAEDYLEAMLMLREQKGYIRSIDIAALLGVTKPSVTYTTKRLRERGLITMNEDNLISLTESGVSIAERTLYRHNMLTQFFVNLGVDEETAKKDACRVEHDLSQQTFDALCRHAEKYSSAAYPAQEDII